jgi:hypothetical protein
MDGADRFMLYAVAVTLGLLVAGLVIALLAG